LFRREQTPACTAVSLDVGVRRDPDREGAESPSFVTSRSVDAMTQGRTRQIQGEKMDTTTLLVIVLVVLLIGGGGFFYRRRV
jgi:LPXTG-motif cell wall-anchored protein